MAVISEIDSDMLRRVYPELDYRLDVCHVNKGGQKTEEVKKEKTWRVSVSICR
jgi:hypothetical protein